MSIWAMAQYSIAPQPHYPRRGVHFPPVVHAEASMLVCHFSATDARGSDSFLPHPRRLRESVTARDYWWTLGRLVGFEAPGDLTFINNHGLLHSREAFEDEGEKSRYLVRLWLKNKALAWKLPRVLREGNERLFEDNEVEEQWNIVPLPKLTFTVAERLSS